MDTRKITMIAAIAVIALVAVGIGFAYTAYTANNGNNTEVSFVSVTQVGGEHPYTFSPSTDIKYDTYNEDNANKIYFHSPSAVNVTPGSMGTYSCATLGSITLHAELEGNPSLVAKLNVDVATSENFEGTGSWIYFLTNNDGSEVYAYKNTSSANKNWTDGPDPLVMTKDGNNFNNVTVYVRYGCLESLDHIEIDDKTFYRTVSEPISLASGKLVFKVNDILSTDPGTSTSATPLATYTVTYSDGAGTPATYVISGAPAGGYTLLDFEKTGLTAPGGKTFSKWMINTDEYAEGAVVDLSGNVTVTAVWA